VQFMSLRGWGAYARGCPDAVEGEAVVGVPVCVCP
jgi:hypothetical protein